MIIREKKSDIIAFTTTTTSSRETSEGKIENRDITVQFIIQNNTITKIRSLNDLTSNETIEKLIIPSSFSKNNELIHVTSINKNVFSKSFRKGSSLGIVGKFTYTINCLYIEDGIEEIDDSAFCNADAIKKVRWPSTCKTIPSKCFEYCDALQEIENIDGVTAIFDNAFAFSGITKFTWPSNCNIIPDGCFDSCYYLKEFIHNDLITRVGELAFMECLALKSFSWPKNCDCIPLKCFARCESLKNITINNNIKNIEAFAFMGTNIEAFEWPSNCEVVSEGCLSNCHNLRSILFSGNITKIGAFAFCGTIIRQFDASKMMLTEIPENAFPGSCQVIYPFYLSNPWEEANCF